MKKNKYIPRAIEKELLISAKEFPVTVLTGPRQSGKTTLLQKLFPKYVYSTFDDAFSRSAALKDPEIYLESLGEKAVIDEIQYVPELLPYIKMSVDKNKGKRHFLLTGSQIFPLMSGIGESLAGRAALYELLGLSFEEMAGHDKHLFSYGYSKLFQMIFEGFYPKIVAEKVNVKNYFRSYVQTYLERDIRQVRSVQDLRIFQNFLELLAARAGNVLNLTEIGKECGISHTTASKWLSLLETTRVIYLIRPYFKNISKRVIKSPKLYFTDTGLLSYLLKYPDYRTLYSGPSSGHIFENFIVAEALKDKFNHNRPYELYYYKDSNDREIDLVLDYGRKLKLIEIKSAKTMREEFLKNFNSASRDFKSAKSFIVGIFDGAKSINGVTIINWKDLNGVLG